MGILLICVLLIITGSVLSKYSYHYDILGLIILVVGCAILFVSLLGLTALKFEFKTLVIEYEEDKNFIESLYNKEKISLPEKQIAIKAIINNNNLIKEHKMFCDNFMIGWFYSKTISNLQLFDLKKLPDCKTDVIVGGVK